MQSPVDLPLQPRRSLWPSWLALLTGLSLTGLGVVHEKERGDALESREFALACQEIRSRVIVRLEKLEAVLLSGVALFEASEQTTRREWKAYVAGLRIGARYPGVQGLGFLRAFPCTSVGEVVQEVRDEGFPSFRTWPEPETGRTDCSSVVWIEPFSGGNLRAFGFDGLSDPARREALERARDEDRLAITGRIVLVQEAGGGARPGAVACAPVYERGFPSSTRSERRERLAGWVYSALRVDELMQGVLEGWSAKEGRRLCLRVFAGDPSAIQEALWDSAESTSSLRHGLTQDLPVDFGGHRWTLRFDHVGRGGETSVPGRAWLVLVAGCAVSVLLWALLLSQRELRHLNAGLEERVVARTRELEESHAELEGFAYSVAHDLKGPLRAASGFTALILEEKGESLDGEARRMLGRVIQAASLGGALVEGLLRYTALARTPVVRVPLDVTALARNAAARQAAREPSRSVEYLIAPGLTAEADPALAREAFERLLDNAWKFTAGRPTARVEVGAFDEGGAKAFFVRDDGAGFEPEHARHLFEPFQRAHAPEAFRGVGIGLAVVARIVHRHGGWIRAEGTPGRGATFVFTLAARRSD